MKDLLKQALDALETGLDCTRDKAENIHESYKGYYPERHAQADKDVAYIEATIDALRAAIAQGESEPVKYEYRWIGGVNDWADVEDSALTLDELKAIPTKCEVRALYAAPVQPDHAPLTDPQIYAIAKQHPRIATLVPHLEVGEFARAIEKAVQPVYVPLTDGEIQSIAYDCNALPEVITDTTLLVFTRAIERTVRGGE